MQGPMKPEFNAFTPESGVARDNQPRWDALSSAGVPYSKPLLDLKDFDCRAYLDRDGMLDELRNRQVLLLAGGGGQQGACLAWLGADVTVLDLSAEQLRREQEAAAAHGCPMRLEQGDMRDLSRFEANTFDIVYHPHSINFVPDVATVFAEVARVLREGGQYRVDCHNPFTHLVPSDTFDPKFGYSLRHPYRNHEVDLAEVFGDDQWVVDREHGEPISVDHPREWVHTLGTFTRALHRHGFSVELISEVLPDDEDPEPGTWEHFQLLTCPYLNFWTRLSKVD